MTIKELYLSKMDAIRETIEALPDDVRICGISDNLCDGMTVQVLNSPNLIADKKEPHSNGQKWCTFIRNGITVGWLETKPPVVAHQCSCCDEPIYEGDECMEVKGFGWLCVDCMKKAAKVAEV